MTKQVEFDENFHKKLNELDDELEDLLLDLINLADITFESGDEFSQAKSYLKVHMKKHILELLGRLQRKRIFDKDI